MKQNYFILKRRAFNVKGSIVLKHSMLLLIMLQIKPAFCSLDSGPNPLTKKKIVAVEAWIDDVLKARYGSASPKIHMLNAILDLCEEYFAVPLQKDE